MHLWYVYRLYILSILVQRPSTLGSPDYSLAVRFSCVPFPSFHTAVSNKHFLGKDCLASFLISILTFLSTIMAPSSCVGTLCRMQYKVRNRPWGSAKMIQR